MMVAKMFVLEDSLVPINVDFDGQIYSRLKQEPLIAEGVVLPAVVLPALRQRSCWTPTLIRQRTRILQEKRGHE